MELHGGNILGASVSTEGSATFRATDPNTGRALEPNFHIATESEIARALELAEESFPIYRSQKPEAIAAFLEAIAAGLESLGEELIARSRTETGLPEARLTGERARTTGQLRMFAALAREGSWVDARIDRGDASRAPAPKPDLRRMLVPLGPVAVFSASNFPLAFSICGGDTASALAVGNPVVTKAHRGHPGTSELMARVMQGAVRTCGMPAGVFSMLQGTSTSGIALVKHPLTRAVGFTGSEEGGRALFDAAAARPTPIPVFAEMGSINPFFVLPGALKIRGTEIAESLAKSVTLGVGQFCTKPGLALGLHGTDLDGFVSALGAAITATPAGTMLHAGIAERYRSGLASRRASPYMRVAGESASAGTAAASGAAAVLTTDAKTFLGNANLREELFGPATLVVASDSRARLEEIARSLEGQLTVTIHATPEDVKEFAGLIDILREKAGRLVFGGVPTGVEVGNAMQHGGPYPASTDSRFTSVGTAAVYRFVRPVCYQDFPAAWLPPELQDANPRGIWRLIDGKWTRDAVSAAKPAGA
jgi:NADP-dependent aldehyde dehydrogenase